MQRLGPGHMDQNVGASLESAARLPRSLGMHTNWQPPLMCGMDNGQQRRIVQQWSTAMQHELDQIVPMCSGLIDRAYAVRRSRQLPYRSRRCPGPAGRVPAYTRQELPSDLDHSTRWWIELPVACDARHPTQVMYFNHRRIGQSSRIHQTKVDVAVDETWHHRTRKPRHAGPLDRCKPLCHRAEFTVYLLEHSRSKAMAHPEIVNGEPHGYLPISVRTA